MTEQRAGVTYELKDFYCAPCREDREPQPGTVSDCECGHPMSVHNMRGFIDQGAPTEGWFDCPGCDCDARWSCTPEMAALLTVNEAP